MYPPTRAMGPAGTRWMNLRAGHDNFHLVRLERYIIRYILLPYRGLLSRSSRLPLRGWQTVDWSTVDSPHVLVLVPARTKSNARSRSRSFRRKSHAVVFVLGNVWRSLGITRVHSQCDLDICMIAINLTPRISDSNS